MLFGIGDEWQFPAGWTLRFTIHAQGELERRKIHPSTIRAVLRMPGEVIESYCPKGYPHWNHLILFELEQPLHVLIALDEDDAEVIVVTAYEPDLALWEPDWRTRRR